MVTELPEITRTISGKGVIEIPGEYLDGLQIYLYTQVIRTVQTPSQNRTWNPDKSFYAHITFCIDDFVLSEYDVNYDSQVYEIHALQPAQNLVSLICAYQHLLESLVLIGAANGVPIDPLNRLWEHPYLQFRPNRIRFECFSSTAILLTLKGTALTKCDPLHGDGVTPPPPPPPVPKVPPGTGIETSPPYDGETDNGDTVPFPTDAPPPPDFPVGIPCERYAVTATFTGFEGAPVITQTLEVSGRIFGTYIDVNPSDATVSDYGVIGERLNDATGICDEQYKVSYVSSGSGGSINIDDVVLIP